MRAKRAWPTWPDSLAMWGLPIPPLLLRCHRSSSRWIRLDLKLTIYRVPWWVVKASTAETQNHKTGAWETKIRGGKLRRGTAGVISTLSNDSTFVTMMKRVQSTSGLWVCGSSYCISLLFLIVLAPYELYNMIMAIFVLPLWWIFLWVEIWDCNCSLFQYMSRCILCTPFLFTCFDQACLWGRVWENMCISWSNRGWILWGG
jgi:hypothetical protein